MKKMPFQKKSSLLLFFIFLAILAGLLLLYPKRLTKARSNNQGSVSIYNNLDTTCNILVKLNDSLYKFTIESDSAEYLNIIHKIKNNNIEVSLSNFNLETKDTFSLPWDEGCGIYIGVDHPSDSIGEIWGKNATLILKDSLGGLYLRKTVIVKNKNIRLKFSVQQMKMKKYIL